MKTFYSHKQSCPAFRSTGSTWNDLKIYPSPNEQVNNYLSTMNYQLINEIKDTEAAKHYYQQKLNYESHQHHTQLQQAFNTISQKNYQLIDLEEQLDRLKKDFRMMNDEYIMLKNNNQADKIYHQTEMENLKTKYEDKLKKIQDEADKSIEVKLSKRTMEIQKQCQQRIQFYKNQISSLTQNSTQLTHQLKILQQDYRNVLLKNDTIIQQSIHRQLRKRDFQSQNNYLRDVAQYEHLKKQKEKLQQEIKTYCRDNDSLKQQLQRINAKLQISSTKLSDLQKAFLLQKDKNKVTLEKKYIETDEIQTNTEQPFVPVIMPVDTNVVGQIVSLRQFLVQKIIEKYVDFFEKSATKEKNKSNSLTAFKNCLSSIKKSDQNALIFFIHSGLQRIIKLYCPAMNYSRQFLTVKDQFIRKTLIECESLTNKEQKLYRLLQLIYRLKHPVNHLSADISTGQLKMLQIKIIATLKKILV